MSEPGFEGTTATTRRTFQVKQYQVTCEGDAQGATRWTCECPEFQRLQGNDARCSHVAIAIDQALEETTDKVYWYLQHRRA